jgi:type IV secretory pathway VirJ component
MNQIIFFTLLIITLGFEVKGMAGQVMEKTFPEVKLVSDQQQTQPPFKSDLILTILPSQINENLPLVFFISGDGGWSVFDQGISEILVEKGMPVIGLNSRKYFWNEKQPKQVADEISRAVEYYMKQWNRNTFVLVGYSFGACVAPFIIPELASSLNESLKGVYCFSPDETGDFKIHLTDLLNLTTNQKYDVLGQMKKIELWKPLCIFGDDEDPEERTHFENEGIQVKILPGDHHYSNNYKAVAEIIFKIFSSGNP